MKFRVVIVDLEIPPRVKRWGLRLGIPLAVLLGAGGIAYATGLVTWSSGQTLQASDLNNNFNYLQEEIGTLQSLASTSGNISSAGAVQRQTPSWVSSANHMSTGAYSVSLQSGFFSGTPDCVASALGGGNYEADIESESQSTVVVYTSTDGALADASFTIVCVGPR